MKMFPGKMWSEMKKESNPDNSKKLTSPARHEMEWERSSRFSLSALKAKAEAARKPPAREDNSGLIDLKAMMAEAEAEKEKEAAIEALHVAAHIPVYPFGPPVEEIPMPAPAAQAPIVESQLDRP